MKNKVTSTKKFLFSCCKLIRKNVSSKKKNMFTYTWNICSQYHSTLQSHNMILTALLQLDFRVLQLHNLKSLPMTSLYTTLTQPDFHCIRKTWFKLSTLAQPKIFFYGKVTYFTLHFHILVFITLAQHDFSGLGFLLCGYVSLYIY